MKVVALGHRKRVGKDTVADVLVDEGWVKLSFAEPLKHGVCNLYGFPYEYYNNEMKETILPQWGKSPRDLLIYMGTEVLRKDNPDHWIKLMEISIEKIKAEGTAKGIVVSDLRFPNEFEFMKKINACCIKIVRESVPNTSDIADNALEGYDFGNLVSNDGSVSDLITKVKSIIGESS